MAGDQLLLNMVMSAAVLIQLLVPEYVRSHLLPFVPLGLDGSWWSIVNTNPTHNNRHQKCDCQHL
jgi:hypothetical protein